MRGRYGMVDKIDRSKSGQILIECQFTKLEAGVTNNLLSNSYHKEGDHYNYTCANSLPIIIVSLRSL